MIRAATGVLTCLLLSSPVVWSCGRPPDFDRDSQAAHAIVYGPVAIAAETDTATTFMMTVAACWKGGLKAGDPVLFTDPHVGRRVSSTAQKYVQAGKANLLFLIRPEGAPAGDADVPYGILCCFGVSSPIADPQVEARFREFRAWQAEELAGWRRLLDLTYREPPADRTAFHREVLDGETNRVLVRYAGGHLPQPLSPRDRKRLERRALKHLDDSYSHISTRFVDLLARAGHRYGAAAAKTLWRKSYLHDDLIGNLDAEAWAALQGEIFDSLDGHRPETRRKLAIELIARCPDFVRTRLEKPGLSFWVLLPFLQEMRRNAGDFGKADLPADVLACDDTAIGLAEGLRRPDAGTLAQTAAWSALDVMKDPDDFRAGYWRQALPLVIPLLSEPPSRGRLLAVCVLRSFGHPVRRKGEVYSFDPRAPRVPLPLKIELLRPEKPLRRTADGTVTLRAREIGVAEATPVCTEGLLLWRYHPVPETGRTTQTGHPDLDALSPPPRERFIVMRKGETREWDAELRLYDEPAGRYAVSLSRFYVHDGWTHGLDAWTGVVNATRPVVIEIRP